MKTMKYNDVDFANDSSLQSVVHSLLNNYQSVAVSQNSFFVNEIPPALSIATDKDVVISLLGDLFLLISKYCRDTCIKISAKAYHDVIVMHIKDTSTFNNYVIQSQLQNLQNTVSKIGGYLEITSQRTKETTIAFSFINQPVGQYMVA